MQLQGAILLRGTGAVAIASHASGARAKEVGRAPFEKVTTCSTTLNERSSCDKLKLSSSLPASVGVDP